MRINGSILGSSQAGRTVLVVAGALVLAVITSGCAALSSSNSFSESSGGVSDSVGSSSDSSTSSSGGDDQAFRDDVEAYAAASLETRSEPDELRRGISEIAMGYGVTDWEANHEAVMAVGRALRASSLSTEDRERYRLALARPGSDADRAMQ